MRTSGLLGAGGGGAAGAGAGAAGCAKLGAGAGAVLSRIQAVQTSFCPRFLRSGVERCTFPTTQWAQLTSPKRVVFSVSCILAAFWVHAK